MEYCAEVYLWPFRIFINEYCGFCLLQGTHGTGKTGKMARNFSLQGKHREFKSFGKNRENTGNFISTLYFFSFAFLTV